MPGGFVEPGERCNWFWGSHGCGLPPGHGGDHVCDPNDPCSRHSAGSVVFIYTDGSGESKPLPMVGYCSGPPDEPCGDPANCDEHRRAT